MTATGKLVACQPLQRQRQEHGVEHDGLRDLDDAHALEAQLALEPREREEPHRVGENRESHGRQQPPLEAREAVGANHPRRGEARGERDGQRRGLLKARHRAIVGVRRLGRPPHQAHAETEIAGEREECEKEGEDGDEAEFGGREQARQQDGAADVQDLSGDLAAAQRGGAADGARDDVLGPETMRVAHCQPRLAGNDPVGDARARPGLHTACGATLGSSSGSILQARSCSAPHDKPVSNAGCGPRRLPLLRVPHRAGSPAPVASGGHGVLLAGLLPFRHEHLHAVGGLDGQLPSRDSRVSPHRVDRGLRVHR